MVRHSWSGVFFASLFLGIVHLRCLDALVGNVKELSACFGNTYDDFLKANCTGTPGQMLAIRQVYAAGKPQSMACPDESTSTNRSEACCIFNSNDCYFTYEGQSRNTYFDNCTGLSSCILAVSRDDIHGRNRCNDSIYRPHTNYMFSRYFCVSNTSVINMGRDDSKTGTVVFLANAGYPAASLIGGNCSVTTSCDANILVTRVDLRLNSTQTLRFFNASGSGSAPLNQFNSTRGIYPLSPPPGNYLRVELTNNGSDPSYLWLQFNATDSRATVTVSCGNTMETVPVNVTSCDKVTTTATTTTTAITTTIMSATGSDTTTENKPSGGDNAGAIAGAVVGVLLVAAIATGVAYFIWRKKQHSRVGQDADSDDSLFSGTVPKHGQVAPRATSSLHRN